MSFLELVVVAIVALLVIPGNRWPSIAYNAGKCYRYMHNRFILIKNQYQAWLHDNPDNPTSS